LRDCSQFICATPPTGNESNKALEAPRLLVTDRAKQPSGMLECRGDMHATKDRMKIEPDKEGER
jgi:hypothetical protein